MIQLAGGSGFIGSRLASLFSEEKFQIFDKNPSVAFPDRVTLIDVRDLMALRQHLLGAEAIVLLAAEHRDDVVPTSLYYGVNVEGDVTFVIGSGISLSAVAGKQTVEETNSWGTPDWTYYQVGVTKSLGAIDVSASWVDSDLTASECFSGSNICEGRALLSVSSSW